MDDGWLNSFAPSTSYKDERPSRRRGASLLQPQNESAAISTVTTPLIEAPQPVILSPRPPKATVLPRAASWYSLRKSPSDQEDHTRIDRRRSVQHDGDNSLADNHGEYSGKGDDELVDASHEDYEAYNTQIELSQNQLDHLLESTKRSLDLLASLAKSFRIVEEQTNAFHDECQSILAEQKRTTSLANGLQENLQYYAYLEPITRRLNAPGATNVVTRKEFPEMLANLDSCLDYMQAHPKQREAGTYQSRYKLLLTRALTLIRVHFTESLRALAADVAKRIADKQLNDTTQSALLYAKFRAAAPELRDLGLEILKRAVPSAHAENEGEAEYQSLMNELYESYAAARGRFILPLVTKKMAEISSIDGSVRDLVAFARSAISFVRGTCLDEYELWCSWFVVDGGVYDFLEAVCEPLFDYLRPRTIHETKLSKLCELCTFLQTNSVDDDDDDERFGDSTTTNGHSRKLNFAALIQPALADAQTRLVFLAMTTLRNEIEYYKPKVEELDYPKKARRRSSAGVNGKQPVLSGRKNSVNNGAASTIIKEPTIVDQDDGDANDSYLGSSLDSASEWYPTLPKAIRLLSRIYRLVNSVVFDDLAHRIVHDTTMSLVAAANSISSKASPTDANLFLISHLLQLKQQIVAFDIEFVAPEITFDFSSLTNTFYELRDRGGLWNPATWYKLAAGGLLPRVVENMLDAKAELDGRLRVVINDLVSSFADRISAPLRETPKKKDTGLDPKRAATAVRGLAEKDVRFLRSKLEEYLDDGRTRETLVAAVKDQVILAYEDWVDIQESTNGPTRNGRPSRKGKGREDEIWSSDVFADWCDATFGSGETASSDDDMDSIST